MNCKQCGIPTDANHGYCTPCYIERNSPRVNAKTMIEFKVETDRNLVVFEAQRGRYWCKSSVPAEIMEQFLAHLDRCFKNAELGEILKAAEARGEDMTDPELRAKYQVQVYGA